MERDYMEYIKKFVKCQQHSNLFNQPLQALQPIQSLWSFSIWALDLIGQISSISLGGHKFIITATKYFTKWVETIPMNSTKGSKIKKFIEHHIIYCFRIPSQIITNNGKNFKNKEVLTLYKGYHIRISFSIPYYP